METKRWLVWLSMLVFNSMILACGGGGSNTPAMATEIFKDSNVLEGKVRCVYSGAFVGTLDGDSSGAFGVVTNTQNGSIRGAAYLPLPDALTEAVGSAMVSYDQTMAFITVWIPARILTVNCQSPTGCPVPGVIPGNSAISQATALAAPQRPLIVTRVLL